MPLSGLRGKRALVSGATSGIGAAICLRLRAEAVHVIATDIHPAPDVIVADLTDADDVERLSAKAGTPDFLVNVAGGPVAPTRSRRCRHARCTLRMSATSSGTACSRRTSPPPSSCAASSRRA